MSEVYFLRTKKIFVEFSDMKIKLHDESPLILNFHSFFNEFLSTNTVKVLKNSMLQKFTEALIY